MADNTLVSYDLNGKKLSFANWISNLSPTDTPFTSMTGKEAINQTLFQWQTDTLEAATAGNAVLEGSTADAELRKTTKQMNNYTQILRKVVKVSDTSNALANYGRGRELQYQMEKAGKEIKRDLESILLSTQEKAAGEMGADPKPRKTGAFVSLVAELDKADEDTKAIVHMKGALNEENLFKLTYNMYLAGSKADTLMFHPKNASFFSSLMESSPEGRNRTRMFHNLDTKFNQYVSEIVDPLGCRYRLIPNRWMPQDMVYAFSASDWTQMVLRAPERTKLAKDGSYEKWMIEMEVGLRHRNPYASGVLEVTGGTGPTPGDKVTGVTLDKITAELNVGGKVTLKETVAPKNATDKTVTWDSSKKAVATVLDGVVTGLTEGTTTITVTTKDGNKTATCEVTVTAAAPKAKKAE
ncbi:major capsid protein [Aeromonas phage BUCT695]|uniref:major capsid protein n=1 Tax=Aeromonas phage BUCT695 TaxID=2908630 RepID=UPI0023291FE4|nr:major capsid protein [Aeromonas phage BUCT695]UIW10597.1 major capsid protein [Aeromonas phage BUCT695]